ncbi:MAG: thioredoxin family protein, partial [Ignavibacteriaceae bacterium]
MKLNLFIMLFLSLVICSGIYAQEKSPKKYDAVTNFDPSRNPAQDVKDAVVEAERSNRRIILDVGGNWCIWCHRIDNFIDENKDLSGLLHKNFVVVKVNYSPENKNEQFLSQYPKIQGYPHFFVLDENGELIHSQDTGKLEKGKGYDKGKFISFIKKW